MAGYLVRRMLEAGLTILVASVLVFAMVAALPGDPAQVILGDRGTPEQLRSLRQYLGLDAPIPVQYARWLGRVVTGDLGYSMLSGIPVRDTLARTLPVTLQLAAWALAVVVLIALPMGIYAGTHPRSRPARLLGWYHGLALAVPVFWLGIVLAWFFGVRMRWVPPSGFVPFGENPAGWARSLVLPGVTLGIGVGSIMARFVQASLEDVLGRDYVRTARAKGAPESVVLRSHVLRNAMLPVVTMLGMDIGLALGGAIFTESVYGLPGLGRTAVQALQNYDTPTIMGVIVFATIVIIVFNLIVDLLYAAIDPRIRLA